MTTTANPDQTMQRLLPDASRRWTRGRTWLAASLAVLALTAVSCFALRPVLHPAVRGSADWSWASSQASTSMIFSQDTEMHIDAYPSAQLTGVSNVPGIQLIGAWVVPARELERVDAPTFDSPAGSADPAAALRDPAVPKTGLPATVRSQDYSIHCEWLIVDCAQVRRGVAPSLTFRTALGTTSVQHPSTRVGLWSSTLQGLDPSGQAMSICNHAPDSDGGE